MQKFRNKKLHLQLRQIHGIFWPDAIRNEELWESTQKEEVAISIMIGETEMVWLYLEERERTPPESHGILNAKGNREDRLQCNRGDVQSE